MTTAQAFELSIVMPCLNEAETLATCIRKAHQGAQAAGVREYEILIADNGSVDGSIEIAEQEGARVAHVPQRGYGAALLGGIAAAQGQFILMGDADDSYDWANIAPFVEKLRDGNQLVMGSRLGGKILPDAMPFLHRWLGNPVLTLIGNILFGARVSDFHCGLRGFSKEAIDSLGLHTPGMEFATEMVVKASLNHLRIAEVPITYYPDGRSRKPHLRTWRDGWRHLSFMLLMSPRWMLLYPAAAIILFGLLINLVLLPGPIEIANIGFDVHTLLVGNVGLIIGVQILLLWYIVQLVAAQMQLLPRPSLDSQLSKRFTLSQSFVFASLLIATGLLLLVYSAYRWYRVDFGPLDYRYMMRLLVPSLTLLTIGVQLFFTSFVLAVLTLRAEFSGYAARK